MTPEEFDEAAHRLLQAEQEGAIHLPADSSGSPQMALPLQMMGGQSGWPAAQEDDELLYRPPPERFTAPERQPTDAPLAPSRRGRRGAGPQGQGQGQGQQGTRRRDTNV